MNYKIAVTLQKVYRIHETDDDGKNSCGAASIILTLVFGLESVLHETVEARVDGVGGEKVSDVLVNWNVLEGSGYGRSVEVELGEVELRGELEVTINLVVLAIGVSEVFRLVLVS